MPFWAIAITTILYAWTAAGFAGRRDWAMAIVFSGYAFANIGMLIYAWNSK